MNITPFPLPSHPFTEIVFRTPTVSDSMEYINIPDHETETVTTRYLNALQVGTVSDSAQWTQEDRRTALWWIFVNSRDEAYMTYSYQCGHCEGIHHADIDMSQLHETLSLLTVPPYMTCSIPVSGTPVNWTIKPMTGQAAELLERFRFALPPEDHENYHQALTDLRLAEIVLYTATDSDPQDYNAAADHRLEMIKRMSLGHEFPALVARINLMKKELRHGLDMDVSKSGVFLNLPMQKCKTKGQEDAQLLTKLRAPFRNTEFIARIRPEWMDNHDQ